MTTRTFIASIVVVICFLLQSAHSAASANSPRLTEKCNAGWGKPDVVLGASENSETVAFANAIKNASNDPDIAYRLWNPVSTRVIREAWGWGFLRAVGVGLLYEQLQDPIEIRDSLQRQLQDIPGGRQFTAGARDGTEETAPSCSWEIVPCTSPNAIPLVFDSCIAFHRSKIMTVTEYYNADLNHYVLATNEDENALVDRGDWGTGWVRTGESFKTWAPDPCTKERARIVHRFYRSNAKWPPSLLYTPKPEECGYLRKYDPTSTYLGPTFGAFLPENETCKPGDKPVYRLNNDRLMFNDSDYRFTINSAIYEDMQQQGWIGDGVAFCIPDLP